MSSIDFLPTILELAGIKPGPGNPIDGVSLIPLLRKKRGFPKRALYWHYPHQVYDDSPDLQPAGAIRVGDYKLIEFYDDGRLELFDLRKDIAERTNVASRMPSRTKQMRNQLETWRRSVGAKMPTPNPNYDPRKERLRTPAPSGGVLNQ